MRRLASQRREARHQLDDGGGSVALTSAHERAYARFRSEIAALSLDETRRITLHVPSVAILVLGAVPKIMTLRPLMVATFVNLPFEALDRLEDRALAAAHAHTRANLLPEDGKVPCTMADIERAAEPSNRLLKALGQSRRRACRSQADEPDSETPAPAPVEPGDGEADAG